MIRKVLHINYAFWTEDRSLSALLVYLCINIFVMPLFALSRTGEIINALVFSMILVSGVFAANEEGIIRLLILMLAAVTIVVHWFNLSARIDLATADIVLSMISWGALAILILFHVFKEGHVSFHRITGAVSVYILFGLICSNAYHLIFMLDPGAFVFPHQTGASTNVYGIYGRFVYFSYETLTTLGFGDIIPINPVAKSLVMVEGLTGQLYPAIMITRLVSLEIESRKSPAKRT